ncbi:sphingosine N-acyltransferase lag1 [Tulasnella sp. 418]|nr:sphingosine N-acyltransferase lag1 [Tulasnella sp. 418]
MSFSSSTSSIFFELRNSPFAAFTRLSYPASPSALNFFPQYQHYDKGWLDVPFVIGWTLVFAIAREVIMRWVCAPFMQWWLLREEQQRALARRKSTKQSYMNGSLANGVTRPTKPKRTRSQADRMREKKVTRFAEQGWSFVYYTYSWVFGMYIHCHSPYYPFNLNHLWIGYPSTHFPIPGPVKFYYLSQLAFWFNQLVILNLEEKRKDYLQMLCHHIITTTLMITSYYMNYTRVGCLILVLLDFGDIFLPLAKMFKYMSLPVLPDITFGIFLLEWLLTRQIMYTMILKSLICDAPEIMPFKWDPANGYYFSERMFYIFITLLSLLLILLCIWFVMIARVAYGVVRGKPAEDTRSDDEDDDEHDADSAPPRLTSKKDR